MDYKDISKLVESDTEKFDNSETPAWLDDVRQNLDAIRSDQIKTDAKNDKRFTVQTILTVVGLVLSLVAAIASVVALWH